MPVQKLSDSIVRCSVPTPFPVGPVNVYLLPEPPVTLVDTGPRTLDAKRSLSEQLSKRGHRVRDVERIVLTHAHVDHFGLANWIRKLSQAEVWVHELDRLTVERFRDERNMQRERAGRALREAGVPQEIMAQLELIGRFMEKVAEAVPVDHVLHDGDEIRIGEYVLRTIHTPGHTSGSICLLEGSKLLLAGDTVLERITPNAFSLYREAHALATYLATLQSLRSLQVSRILPGHGHPFRDLRKAVDMNFKQYHERCTALLQHLTRSEHSAYKLAEALFGRLEAVEVALAVSEVLGHLGILVEEGSVVTRERDGVVLYARSR